MLKKIIIISKPSLLFLLGLAYSFGAGIADYLGRTINFVNFWLGLVACLTILFSALLFDNYFRLPLSPLSENETPRQRQQWKILILQAAFASLSISLLIWVIQLFSKNNLLIAEIIFFVTILIMLAFAVPPFRLSEAGYGEIVLAIYLGTLVPALGFLEQYHGYHRLLTLATFPLALVATAYFLVTNFPSYSTDMKFGRRTLLTRLTWQDSIPVHHFLYLTSFLLFAISPFMGVPWGVIWPVFLVVPFAAVQIIWIQRIAGGAKPYWNILIGFSTATFGLIIYLLTLSFWTR
jgi:1,4-dihydroxy-2-naphthoate octaprenyltransferase